MRRQPTIAGIIRSDYGALLLLLAPIVMGGIYLASAHGLPVISRRSRTQIDPSDPTLLWVALVAAVVCLPALVVRVVRIRRVFATGTTVMGRITSLYLDRDRGRVEYAYRLGRKEMHAGAAIHRNDLTEGLAVGQQLELVVDPAKPTRAFVVDLY